MFPESSVEESEAGYDYAYEYLHDLRDYLVQRHNWKHGVDDMDDRNILSGQLTLIQQILEAIENTNGEN